MKIRLNLLKVFCLLTQSHELYLYSHLHIFIFIDVHILNHTVFLGEREFDHDGRSFYYMPVFYL